MSGFEELLNWQHELTGVEQGFGQTNNQTKKFKKNGQIFHEQTEKTRDSVVKSKTEERKKKTSTAFQKFKGRVVFYFFFSRKKRMHKRSLYGQKIPSTK